MTDLKGQLSHRTLILGKKPFEKSKYIILRIVIIIIAILIPLLQVVPTTYYLNCTLCLYVKPESMPLFLYFYRFNLSMITADYYHFISYPGSSLIALGFILLITSLIFQVYNRNRLVKIGTYKYLKHPQYLAICLITLGLTIKSINTRVQFSPFQITVRPGLDNLIILIIWLIQVLFYIILAKIENYSSKKRLGIYYLEYNDDIKSNWKFLFKIKRNYLKVFILVLPIYVCFLLEYLNTIFILW